VVMIVLVYITNAFKEHYRYDIASILDIFTYTLVFSVMAILVIWDDL